jgi:hypothetical protein
VIKSYLELEDNSEEDKVLDEIIHGGKNPEVDLIISLLQVNLKKSGCMWWNASGDEGLVLSRCAFACMIKVMNLTDDFMAMIDEISM